MGRTGITRLNNPVNDATDIKAALEGLGFTVDMVSNGNRVQMEGAVSRLKSRLSVSKNAYGFFFYAGHGVQYQGMNYLIPVDANIPSESYLPDRAVNVQVVLDELNTAGNELNMIVLDACRDNPFGWSRGGTRGLGTVSHQPPSSIIVYATSAGSTSADGQGRNGFFTTHLLKNLKTSGLEVSEIFRRTGSDVRQASNNTQIPAIYSQYFETAYLGKGAAPVQPSATRSTPTIPDGFVKINGGTFLMGSPSSEAERGNREVQHKVTVSGFYMGKYEVTQREYEAVMGTNPSYFKGPNLPVETVSWFDAVEYCNKRSQREGLTAAYTISGSGNNRTVSWNRNASGYRLPTEAEWEYACRAGTATPFSTGNNITTSQANYDGNSPYNSNAKGTYREKTTAAGSFTPNSWGLYDMHGNVWEWCWDWYDDYSNGAQTEPTGAASGSYRVLRGGGWLYSAHFLRSAYRLSATPSYRTNLYGFRVVRP
ncbi:hypothetical protein AGMMS49944_17520 [Spirochaetia bacterium]|nr:hypothetical protein AGMMS49944_17520 [Spirochaetia bacterium]